MTKTITSLALLAVVACGPTATQQATAPADPAAKDGAAKTDTAGNDDAEGKADAPANPAAACLEEAARRITPNVVSDRITVSHILVKYAGAERAADSIKRTREEACLRAAEALAKMKAGADFTELVAEYSDEDGAGTRGGSIGEIRKGDVKPDFATAAFAIRPNQVSHVVETTFGFHIIMRTE